MLENEIQRKILSASSFFKDGAKYSDLQIREIANDLFNYHLQQLVEKEFLLKLERKYYLSEKGKTFVTNIDEDSLELSANYKVSTYICPVVAGKILLHRRLKHPQYGYVGLISEKKKYGEELFTTARRGLKEEAGLDAHDFTILGNLHQIRKNNQAQVIEDGVFYVVYTDKVVGELIEKSIEGEYFWIELEKVKTIEHIFKPSLEKIIAEVEQRLSGTKSFDEQFICEFSPEPEQY